MRSSGRRSAAQVAASDSSAPLNLFVRLQMGGENVRTTIEGRRFLHKELWRVVTRQLDHGSKIPTGAFYDDLVAMVFALHAFEAYLNFVGGLLAPDIWEDERNYFRREPFRGFDGKLRKVFELVGVPEPSRNSRPYSTVWVLKDLRDLIAHAKPEEFGDEYEHDADDQPPFHRTNLDLLITCENAECARTDVEAVATVIHLAAKPKVNDIWFGTAPFGGPLQHSSGSTTLAT